MHTHKVGPSKVPTQQSQKCWHVWSPICQKFGHHCDHHDARSASIEVRATSLQRSERLTALQPSSKRWPPGVHEICLLRLVRGKAFLCRKAARVDLRRPGMWPDLSERLSEASWPTLGCRKSNPGACRGILGALLELARASWELSWS